MNNEAHVKNEKPRKKIRYRMNKTFFALLAVIMLISVGVGTSVAFLMTKTDSVTNNFEYAKVSCAVCETFNGNSKTNVQIKNTGSTDAYIRATYVVNWLDNDKNIVASVPEGYSYELDVNPDRKWEKKGDGYFYYLTPVAPNDKTEGSLLNCTVSYPENPKYTLSVEILATAIQSSPTSAAESAWGITITNTGN